jgi:ABC-type antimicrobial peptide transport system permease subunit
LAIGLGIAVFYLTNSLLTGPSFEDRSINSRIDDTTVQTISCFINPAAIVIMLLAALVSAACGSFYWLVMKRALAK